MGKKRVPSPHIYPFPRAPFMILWQKLPNCELRNIIDEGLVALKEDRCAGNPIEK